jgi:hypothetical protein
LGLAAWPQPIKSLSMPLSTSAARPPILARHRRPLLSPHRPTTARTNSFSSSTTGASSLPLSPVPTLVPAPSKVQTLPSTPLPHQHYMAAALASSRYCWSRPSLPPQPTRGRRSVTSCALSGREVRFLDSSCISYHFSSCVGMCETGIYASMVV